MKSLLDYIKPSVLMKAFNACDQGYSAKIQSKIKYMLWAML